MAFTKVVGPGIHSASNVHTHNINSAGIITATKFVGPFDNINVGGATTLTVDGINISAGILTAQTLDLNGNGDISGNLVVGGNLTANGDLTTLNTTLREVELLRVDASSALAAGIITQRGAGDALAVDFDYGSDVIERAFTIHKDSTYGELVGIGTNNPGTSLHIQDVYTSAYPFNAPVAGFLGALKYPHELALENAVAGVNGSWTGIMFRSGANSSGSAHGVARVSAVQTADNQADLTFSTRSGTFGERLRITGIGSVGIGTTVPTAKLDVRGDLSVSSGIVVSGGTVTIPTVAGTNTNAALNVLFQTASGVIDGGSQLTYNPGGDVLSVNGNHISANTFRGDGNQGTLTCDNHSSSTFVTVSDTVDISTVDNATDAFTVKQGSNEYITVDTTNTSELITLGNTTTNPNVSILAGSVTLSGNLLPSSAGSLDIGSISAEIGDVYLGDDKRLFFGSDQDFSIKHSGTNAFIDNDVGNLNIQSDTVYIGNKSGGSIFAEFTDGGASKLKYAGGLKFETTGIGVSVHGEVAASQDYPQLKPTLDLNFVGTAKLDPRVTFTREGSGSYYGRDGLVKFAATNEPRFDHDPVTRECKGLLHEQQGQNMFPYTTTPGDSGWTSSKSGTFVQNTTETAAPDGTFTATKWTFTNTDPYLYDVQNLSANATYTLSMWVKAGTNMAGDRLQMRIGGAPYSSGDAEVIPADGTWRRVTYTRTIGGSAENSASIGFEPQTSPSGNPASGDVIYIWGPQLEESPHVTSYISSNSSHRALRGADKTFIDGQEFTDFYNQIEGTIFLSASYIEDNRSSGIVTIDDTSNSAEYTEVGYRAGGAGSGSAAAYIRTTSGGDQYYKGWSGSATQGNEFKVVLGYKDNDYASSANGETVHTDSSGTTSKVYDRLQLSSVHNVNHIGSSYYRRLIYYPKRLPNSQLVTLTS